MKRALVLAMLAACGDNIHLCDATHPFCDRISEYGLFTDLRAQTPAADLIPYTVATPLFSDYTTKYRYLRLPPGGAAHWSDVDAFDLPVGTMLVKTFAYLHDRRDPSKGQQLLETRLLVHGEDGWDGATYVYDGDGGDASLEIAGDEIDASWIHDDGSTRTNQYAVPNQNQCKNCHGEHADRTSPLGPKARHLNTNGQLQALIAAGELEGAPPESAWPAGVNAMDPSTGTLDQRAREWLDINCGHCHNPSGFARTSGLFLDITETDPAKWGVCKPPVATGRGSGGFQYDIVPGHPETSILVFRMNSTEPEVRMPELARNLVYDEGVALISSWISSLPGSCGT